MAIRLGIDGHVYEALLMNLDAHASRDRTPENGGSVGLELLAAWRHEFCNGTYRSSALFQESGATDLIRPPGLRAATLCWCRTR